MLAARGSWFGPRSTRSRGDNPKVAWAHSGRVPVPNLAFDNFANNIDDRRFITGYIFLLVSWNCQTQHTTPISTIVSEYYAFCKTVQEALYLRMMLKETSLKVDSPLIIKEDYKACISFSKDSGEHRRTKHIDNRHFFCA